jgi:hypothetical protein
LANLDPARFSTNITPNENLLSVITLMSLNLASTSTVQACGGVSYLAKKDTTLVIAHQDGSEVKRHLKGSQCHHLCCPDRYSTNVHVDLVPIMIISRDNHLSHY